jgi:hypothetical protein
MVTSIHLFDRSFAHQVPSVLVRLYFRIEGLSIKVIRALDMSIPESITHGTYICNLIAMSMVATWGSVAIQIGASLFNPFLKIYNY